MRFLTPLVIGSSVVAPLFAQTAPVQLDGAATASFPQVVTDGNQTVAAWVDGETDEVKVAYSDAYAQTWSSPVTVSSAPGAQALNTNGPSLFLVGGEVFVAWEDERDAIGSDEVYFAYSVAGSFVADQRIDKGLADAAGANPVRDWRMDVETGSFGTTVVFGINSESTADAESDDVLVWSASYDGGANFSTAVAVPAGALGDFDVPDFDMDVEGDTVHLAWVDVRNGDEEVYYERLENAGAGFVTTQDDARLDDVTAGNGVSGAPAIAAAGSTVCVAWLEQLPSTGDLVWLARDTGKGFSAAEVAPHAAGVDVDGPIDVVVNGSDEAVLIWEDDTNGSNRLFTTVTANGLFANPLVEVSGNLDGGGGFPRFFTNSGVIGAIFNDGINPHTAGIVTSLDGGATWQSVSASEDSNSDVDFASGAYNAISDAYIAVFESNDLGSDNVYSTLSRPATLAGDDFIVGGSPSFLLDGFPANTALCWVLAAFNRGDSTLPTTTLNSLLAFDGLTTNTLNMPGTFLALMDGMGAGQTTPTMPPFVAGFSFHAIGVGLELGPIAVNTVTTPVFIEVEDIIVPTDAGLVINEIDYDQPGSDTGEFVEIYNASMDPISLTGVVLEMVNGNGDSVYNTYALDSAAAELAPGEFLVVGVQAVIDTLPAGTPSVVASNNFAQNGAPDGARLVGSDASVLDSLSYEGNMSTTEGSGGAGTDSTTGSLSRLVDGQDTDDNSVDFGFTTTSTPGAANVIS